MLLWVITTGTSSCRWVWGIVNLPKKGGIHIGSKNRKRGTHWRSHWPVRRRKNQVQLRSDLSLLSKKGTLLLKVLIPFPNPAQRRHRTIEYHNWVRKSSWRPVGQSNRILLPKPIGRLQHQPGCNHWGVHVKGRWRHRQRWWFLGIHPRQWL